MQNNPIISFKNVSLRYPTGTRALSDVSFDVTPREFVCFVGRNGSGKSTIAKLIDALIYCDLGSIRVFDLDASDPQNAYPIRSRIGYVFQNPMDQIVNTTVEAEVAFGPENLGLSSSEIRRRVNESLERACIESFAKCNVNDLSGGQLQRVALAGALAMEPELLIFDETASMLDPESSKEFFSILEELHKEGKTIITISHNETEARMADRLIALSDGVVSYDGKPTDEVLCKVFPLLPTREELEYESGQTHDGLLNHRIGEKIIRFDSASYSYSASKTEKEASMPLHEPAISDISLSIHEGEAVAIMGRNGSGKSTLIRHMNGLLKPTSGKVRVRDTSTDSKHGALEARKHVGLCFQYPERQLFAKTVYDDIAFGPANSGLSDEQIDERVRNAMAILMLDPDEYALRNPFGLSGGEQRRVAIAGVLAMDPEVLVLDEPCANLDPFAHIEFLHLIARLKACGKTIVIVTHDEREAELLSDRIIRMKDGRIL